MKNFNRTLENWDSIVIEHTKKWALPMSRFAIFFVYFYFGAIKVFSLEGAANPMVVALLHSTLPSISPESFLVAFGVFEMLIGLIFIIPNLERLGIFVLALHLFTTVLPLVVLPEFTWHSFMVPTLEGQYIIKNILIIALAIGILGHLHVYKREGR
ncbi:hypothetical protein HZA26_00340 [Candidatus Nomurabacteria bacterium]|nr:hypothetical protein [Candidatus Nomurabacteria bacterium]